MEFSTEDSPP
jgi:hypothetical protein